jgi:FkbM family methyltransferase
VNGHRLFVDTRDRQIAPHLATVGLWEPWNQSIFRHVLSAGDVVVDVGSNVGYFVLLAGALVGDQGRVYSFEADPSLARLLAASVRINGHADRTEVRQLAVSDAAAREAFTSYPERRGDGHLSAIARMDDDGTGSVREVETDTLDRLLADQSDVRLLHIDAEGAEPRVLRGARSLIARSPRLVLLMEWGLAPSGEVEELDWLAAQGFAFSIVRHDGGFRAVTAADLRSHALCDVLCYRGPLSELRLGA